MSKRARKKKANQPIDKGTPEFQKKVTLSTYKGITHVVGQLKVDELNIKGIISDEQYQVADKFLTLFTLSGTADRLGARVSQFEDRIAGSEDDRRGQEEYEYLYRQAYRAIRCVKEAKIVEDVCCYNVASISPVQITMLRSGLNDLIRYWSKKKKAVS